MKMKKRLILILLVIVFLLGISVITHAGTPHGVIGFVNNASDGTDVHNAAVNFSVINSTGQIYCTLTDTVGVYGNSGQASWYAQDVGNCQVDWEAGDTVNISIVADAYHTASTQVDLTNNGSDQAPDTQLSSSPFPTATASHPSQGDTETSNLVPFTLKCTDSVGVSTLQLWGNFTGTWALNATNSSPGNNVNLNRAITLPDGVYKWAAWCNDTDGNNDSSENITFSVAYSTGGGPGGGGGDTEGNATNRCGDNRCNRTSADFNFTCSAWYENQRINNISLYGNWLGGWHLAQSQDTGSNRSNVTVKFGETVYSGIYDWNCYACTSVECFFVKNSSNFTLDAQIEGSESWVNCCTDCGCLTGYSCLNSSCKRLASCGDGNCTSGETQANCCTDCGCPTNYTCTSMGCLSNQRPASCGDGFCDITKEDIINCPKDCINRRVNGTINGTILTGDYCGDKKCGKGENQTNCCTDCGCPKGERCTKNKCVKFKFPWWILWVLLGLAIAFVIYIIIKKKLGKTSLAKVVINIGKELDKKKYSEVQRKTAKGRKFDFDKQNSEIDKNIFDGLEICRQELINIIKKGEIKALEKLVEKKKDILHSLILSFEDYRKIIRKERLAFEEDLKEILFAEEIPKYEQLKRDATNLYAITNQIKLQKINTSFNELRE